MKSEKICPVAWSQLNYISSRLLKGSKSSGTTSQIITSFLWDILGEIFLEVSELHCPRHSTCSTLPMCPQISHLVKHQWCPERWELTHHNLEVPLTGLWLHQPASRYEGKGESMQQTLCRDFKNYFFMQYLLPQIICKGPDTSSP